MRRGRAGRIGSRALGACWRAVGLAACLVALPASGSAQRAPASAGTPTPDHASADLQVFLMTFGPGRQVWERFGHNAIWIHDPVHGTDEAYNYGLFDFHQENFLLRFVRGQMWYWMAGLSRRSYVAPVRAGQPLGLGAGARPAATPPRLRAASDSCDGTRSPSTASTTTTTTGTTARPGSAMRSIASLGGALRRQTDTVPAGTTYRFHTQRLTANDPLIFTGLLLALGRRGGSADFRLGGDVPAAQDAGQCPAGHRARARRRPRAAGPVGAHHLRIVGRPAARDPALVAGLVSRGRARRRRARPWCSRGRRANVALARFGFLTSPAAGRWSRVSRDSCSRASGGSPIT